MQRKFFSASVESGAELGPRQIRVRASDATLDRVGDILEPSGCVVRGSTVPALMDHDPKVTSIIGRATPEIDSSSVCALIDFVPEGIDPDADKSCGKAKAGFIPGISVGFDPIEWEPIKGGGVRYTKWELLEISLVAIACNPSATVIERAMPQTTVTIDAAELAELRAKAEAPKKLADSFRTLAKSLPDTAKGAKGQLLRCANMAESEAGAVITKESPKLTAKGLYQVGQLASVLADLDWCLDAAEWEAEWEGDDSAVPGMLAAALRQLGAALIAMTNEEVAELLAELAEEEGEGGEADKSAPTITVKDIVGALHGKAIAGLSLKAGRVLSAKNETDLTAARDLIDGVVQQVATDTEAAKAARIREAEALRLACA